MISTFEDGSDVGFDLIDLACLEERAEDPSPAFDQEVGHGALTEFGQERHDWHAGLAREDDDLAAPCLEGMAAVGRGLPRDGDENGDFMSCLHEPAIQRQQRLAVENDPGRGSAAGRAVSWGSSASTVPIPTRIASIRPLSWWTREREPGEEIHWLSPEATAVLPSRVIAHLAVI